MEALRDTQKIISPMLQRASSFHPGKYVDMPGGYKVFHPSLIHCHWKWDDPETLELCDLAYAEIERMNGLTQELSFLPQVHKMHLFYEATLSCRLSSIVPWEFSLRDAACQAEYVPYENVKPWRIINDNYTRASAKVVNSLESGRLISLEQLGQINVQLLDNTSYANHDAPPFKYRQRQTWVGCEGIRAARYVPPESSKVPAYMEDLYNFWITPGGLPYLLKMAIGFYQMLNIMPYTYGNTLEARMILMTVGIADRLISGAYLCMSEYYCRLPMSEFDHYLERARRGELLQWVRLFLIGVIETSRRECVRLRQIRELQQGILADVNRQVERTATPMRQLVEVLFGQPVIAITEANRQIGLSRPTTSKMFLKLQHQGWIEEITGDMRYRIFHFDKYLKLFE